VVGTVVGAMVALAVDVEVGRDATAEGDGLMPPDGVGLAQPALTATTTPATKTDTTPRPPAR